MHARLIASAGSNGVDRHMGGLFEFELTAGEVYGAGAALVQTFACARSDVRRLMREPALSRKFTQISPVAHDSVKTPRLRLGHTAGMNTSEAAPQTVEHAGLARPSVGFARAHAGRRLARGKT